MGKKDEFDLEEGASLLGTILVTMIALVLVGAVFVGAYFMFFGDDATRHHDTVGAGVESNIPEESAKPESTIAPTPKLTEAPTSKPNIEAGEENPTGMGQDPEGEGVSTGESGAMTSGEQSPAVTPEAIVTPEPVNVEEGHNFTEVNEVVAAKEATNLRDMPSQGKESKVKVTLYNGQVATRIGISDSGWSKVTYDGKTYYAVSSYLTTDLTPPTPVPADDGIKTVFTERDEMVAPKIEVNLRTLPSVTNPESVVVVKLPYGTQVRRTGINTDVGWSRVEYEGQVLYCVSSYVFVVEQAGQ